MKRSAWRLAVGISGVFIGALVIASISPVRAQRGGPLSPEAAAKRWEIEKQLEQVAIIDRKAMVPMRDGLRLATDVYRPKD
ncbi:MAG TPA: hypothetical protein VI756_00620, partial [Blastocatellia bacterium]